MSETELEKVETMNDSVENETPVVENETPAVENETPVVEDETSPKDMKEEEDEDSNLVSAEDLKEPEVAPKKITTKWDDAKILEQLSKEMDSLQKVRFRTNYGPAILTKAMADVFASLGWKNYETFQETVHAILTGPRNGPGRIPYSLKTRNNRTGRMDFWLIRSFITIGADQFYDDGETKVLKKTVLMSGQFDRFLKKFCRGELKDELQFWKFTGSFKGKMQLDLSRLIDEDMEMLPTKDPNNLVMFQFKMKSPEIRIGVRKKQEKKPVIAAEEKTTEPVEPRETPFLDALVKEPDALVKEPEQVAATGE